MTDYIREGAIRRLLKDIDPEARIGAEALETLADYLTDYAASCLKGVLCVLIIVAESPLWMMISRTRSIMSPWKL